MDRIEEAVVFAKDMITDVVGKYEAAKIDKEEMFRQIRIMYLMLRIAEVPASAIITVIDYQITLMNKKYEHAQLFY